MPKFLESSKCSSTSLFPKTAGALKSGASFVTNIYNSLSVLKFCWIKIKPKTRFNFYYAFHSVSGNMVEYILKKLMKGYFLLNFKIL
ncbi:hypothetical protein Yangon190_03780 [Helicobacter pylori]